MGGIAGVFNRRGEPVEREELARISAALVHRGPAGQSGWCRGPVGLAHIRDRVLPQVHPPGQPYTEATGRHTIICNGRIFNAREIQRQLPARRTNGGPESILETILRAYLAWGGRAFARFNGSFAVAIWDDSAKRLVLARDHLGVKPLFYRLTESYVVFGSEVKAVLQDPRAPVEPDDAAIADYLTANRYTLHTEATFYRGVRRLLPARILTVSADDEQTETYWEIDPGKRLSFSSDAACIEATREIMVESVRLRLPENQVCGAALSGGFDSSSIVCLARHLDRTERDDRMELKTFSYNFDSEEADEDDLIRLVAERVGAEHHADHVLQPDFYHDLDDVIRANDGPVVESSALLLFKKKRRIRQADVDVQLSGLGGDEIFQGQLNYFADLLRGGDWLELYREVHGVYPVDRITGKHTSLSHLAKAFILSPLTPLWFRRLRHRHNGLDYPPDWISGDLLARTRFDTRVPNPARPRFRTIYDQDCYDLFYYELAGPALQYHDCVGNAFGVDTRFPLLDVRLVETMFALPREWKIQRGQVRRMQKAAMAPYLPREILEDHLKKDPHPTVVRFMQQTYRREIREFMSGSKQLSRAYLDWPALERHLDPFLADRRYNPLPLWFALSLERWLRLNFGAGAGHEN